jgi:type II secretory pathway component GspD/PulD (secretin)
MLMRNVSAWFVLTAVVCMCATTTTFAQQPTLESTNAGVLVDFQDVDLKLVITALAEAGDVNVTYGDLPLKKITLHMRQPVPKQDIRALLRSISESNGLETTEDGNLLHVEEGSGNNLPNAAAQEASRVGLGRDELRLYVYLLKHARAAHLSSVLQAIFGGGNGPALPSTLSTVPLSTHLRQERYQPRGTTHHDQSTPDSAISSATLGSLPAQLQGEVLIVPDEGTNALLIRAGSADWPIVKQAIESLDLRPLQVMIDVLIVEVQHTRDLSIGVSGHVSRTAGDSLAHVSGGSLAGTSNDFMLRLVTSGKWNVDLALSALATRGNVRILSRPVLLAQNNQEARILVGSERPFIQVSRVLPTETAAVDQVVQYRDVGTSLTILPTISPDGYVNLQVLQQVSSATSEVQFGAPIISTREAATHLFVHDGQTAVIGGLIDRQDQRTRSGIPVLMNIPILGALFGTTTNTSSSSELFLFLTPHIIATDDDTDRVREEIQKKTPGLNRELPALRSIIPNVNDSTERTPSSARIVPR